MNGMRMNQSVAPTSFITSISRRLANIAVRIVFQINSTAANMSAIARPVVYEPGEALQLGDQVDLVLGELDGVHVRQIVGTRPSRPRRVSTSVPSLGTTLNWVGMFVSSSSSRERRITGEHPVGVGERALDVAVRRTTGSMTPTLLVERGGDDVALIIARLGADVHDHLDPALPLDEQVVEAVLDQQRETEDQQRDGRRDDRRHGEGHVAFEARPGLTERVCQA